MNTGKKNAVVADWTTVPGWDGAKQEYVELDCERWIRENKIREAGRENGKQEFPPSEAVQPDEIYMKIVDWVNQRGKACHAAVSMDLVQKRHALEQETEQGMAPIRHKVKGLRDQGIVALADQAKKDRSSLTQKKGEAREAGVALAAFKSKANLGRVAEYYERDTWYWWLVGIVVIEALANAMMLARVHEHGLLGAIATMILIGVVNAGILGCMIGEGWRQKNSVRPGSIMGGWLMVGLGAMIMAVWNLLVGHFRDSMLAVAQRASSLRELLTDDTIGRFLINPFGLEGFISWGLAAVGVGCCIFAATKWLKRDDVYPGYGAVHRAATEYSEEFREEIEQRRANLERIYEEYTERIRDERLKVEHKKGGHRVITDKAKETVRQFPMQLRQYQSHLDFILAAYRTANEKARATPNPEFFAQRFSLDQDMLEPPPWQDVPPPDYDEDWESFHQAEDAIRRAYQDAQSEYPTFEDLIESEGERERLEK